MCIAYRAPCALRKATGRFARRALSAAYQKVRARYASAPKRYTQKHDFLEGFPEASPSNTRMGKRYESTVLDESFEELVSKVISDKDALVVILRGHLITELLVNEVYLGFSKLGAAKKKLRKVINATFRSKIDALHDGHLIERRHYKPLKALNKIRNSFAHLPLKVDLSTEDERAFLKSFSQADRELVLEDAKKLGKAIPHLTLRYGLMLLCASLSAIARHTQDEGPMKFRA